MGMDLRHPRTQSRVLRCRSSRFFHTCANPDTYLRQEKHSPAPTGVDTCAKSMGLPIGQWNKSYVTGLASLVPKSIEANQSIVLLEQVGRPFGAGVTFGDGPAPPQDAESCFAVQVIALFPHLRQSGHIPAPRKTFTCANWRGHLRQEHGLADRSMEQVVRCRTGNTCAGKHLICSCIWENGEERGRRCSCERWCAGYVRLSAATPGRKRP